MERFRSDVSAVRPADRAELRVKLHASEVRRIAERLEDAGPIPVGGVKLTSDTIVEGKAQTMRADNLDLDDSVQMRGQIHAHDATQAGRCAPAARSRAREPS